MLRKWEKETLNKVYISLWFLRFSPGMVMLFQLMQWEQKNIDGTNALQIDTWQFVEVIHTNLSVHWMFHAYSLCTGTCVEVEMKGLVVSVFFSSVPGEHLTLHKKLTSASAGNCLFVKPIVTFFGRCQLGTHWVSQEFLK